MCFTSHIIAKSFFFHVIFHFLSNSFLSSGTWHYLNYLTLIFHYELNIEGMKYYSLNTKGICKIVKKYNQKTLDKRSWAGLVSYTSSLTLFCRHLTVFKESEIFVLQRLMFSIFTLPCRVYPNNSISTSGFSIKASIILEKFTQIQFENYMSKLFCSCVCVIYTFVKTRESSQLVAKILSL